MNELIDTKNISDEFNDLIKEFDLTPETLKKIPTQDAKRKENFSNTYNTRKNENLKRNQQR